MRRTPVRRAQLIAPFGVGSILVARGGTSLIVAGLDHWYLKETAAGGSSQGVHQPEFNLDEPRLAKQLGVSGFRTPPDFKNPSDSYLLDNPVNIGLTVPALRFPNWHYCDRCGRMKKIAASAGRIGDCPECKANGLVGKFVQVRIIAMCDHGHVQDFPWNEWVHHSASPTCHHDKLKLTRGSGTSLDAFRVQCENCNQPARTLGRITTTTKKGKSTFLTDQLTDDDDRFLCRGQRPWLGSPSEEQCDRPLWGSLPGAANVYFSHVESSLYVSGNEGEVADVVELLKSARYAFGVNLAVEKIRRGEADWKIVRNLILDDNATITDSQLRLAVGRLVSENEAPPEATDDPSAFRRVEYEVLRLDRADDSELEIRANTDRAAWTSVLADHFTRINRVERLKETRALVGFSRVFPDAELPPERERSLLRSAAAGDDWLPAYSVYGEGLFLELDPDRLADWEERDCVVERAQRLDDYFLSAGGRLRGVTLSPRFLLIHSLAHVLMNQLVFECGYGTASLRERLYVDCTPRQEMAGLLIYTAAGDADGTLGGLVNQASPKRLGSVISHALQNAQWCSADPVCMEAGESGGQGPASCNLAACHSCALVPETSCEHFNRFLDRGMLVGTADIPDLAYFTFGRNASTV